MVETAPPHGFPDSEFAARTERAQAIMAAHGFDALVVCTPPNVRYVCGFDSQFWESPTRPWFVVVPADGAPIAVVPEIGAPAFAATWLERVESWPAPQPADDGTSLLAGVLDALPRRSGRIGFELGREQALRMPVSQFLALRDRLPGLELADGGACLWEIRMVKTPAEIDRIRHVCRLASDAYAAVPDLVAPGDTEREACRNLRIELLRRGADTVPFLPCISGPGGVAQIVCGPGDRVLQAGDLLFFDTGATYDGYFCDFDRNYAVGAVAEAATRAHDAMWRATEAGIAAARPGATAEEVFRAIAAVCEEAGSLGNNVGRMGHGLGLQLTEPPSNMPGDTTVLRPGMVLTIEPSIAYAPGRMITHEENLALTEDGSELLTKRAPRELPVIA